MVHEMVVVYNWIGSVLEYNPLESMNQRAFVSSGMCGIGTFLHCQLSAHAHV